MSTEKIFCVGFQKTGTSSLGVALNKLGYRVCGYDSFRHLSNGRKIDENILKALVFELSEQFDVFKDTPWPIFYKELDIKYPNSKFILVVRNTDKWFKSALKDFGTTENAIHNYIYGVSFPLGNEEIFKKRYERHNRDVTQYFERRPNHFLRLDLDAGEVNWKSICIFLGKDIPEEAWPYVNTANSKQREKFVRRVKNYLVKRFKR